VGSQRQECRFSLLTGLARPAVEHGVDGAGVFFGFAGVAGGGLAALDGGQRSRWHFGSSSDRSHIILSNSVRVQFSELRIKPVAISRLSQTCQGSGKEFDEGWKGSVCEFF
jgi:hypothetical protein